MLNVAVGPLVGAINGSAATPWFRALLFDSVLGGGMTAIDPRTWDGSTGDAAESITIAAIFGAAGSLGGRAAHGAIEGRHSPGLTSTSETGERIRIEVKKGSGEVRIVDESGTLLRTGKMLRRGVDEVGRPTNELVMQDTRPGHKNEVFTVSLGHGGPMAEPGTGPSDAALPIGVRTTTQHPVLGSAPVVTAGPSPVEHFSYAAVGERVRVSAPNVPTGDYVVVATDQHVLTIEVGRPVNLSGGTIVEAGGVQYMVTRGNAGMPNGVGLNEMAIVDVASVPELRGKKNGEVVTIGSRKWRLRFTEGLPAGKGRIVAEAAVDPVTVGNRLPPGGTMNRRIGAITSPLRVEGGRLVEPETRSVRAQDVQRTSSQQPLSQAAFDAMLHPAGAPRGSGQTWVSVEDPKIRLEAFDGNVVEVETKEVYVGNTIHDANGTRWDVTAVDLGQGTYTIQEHGNPGNVTTKRLFKGAWEVAGYDPASGQVSLRRTDVRVEGTHYVDRVVTGFPTAPGQGVSAGRMISDTAGKMWTITAVDEAAHTVQLTDGTTTQTAPFADTARQQLRLAEFGAPIEVSSLAPGQVITDLAGRPWEVFEVNRGSQPRVSLRRTETRVEPVENIRRSNPRGARARVDLEPKTQAMLTGNRINRGLSFLSRWFSEGTGVPKVGAGKVTDAGTGPTQTRALPMSYNPAAVPDALGAQGNLPVTTREYFFQVQGPDGATQRVRVLVPDAGVTLASSGGSPGQTLTADQVLTRAKSMLADMPTAMVGKVQEIRFNPADNAQDIYWRRGNPQFTASAMTAGHGTIDVYPEGLRPTGGKQANAVYMQITWHEMGHLWADKVLGTTEGDHLWRAAMEADGPQNLPSQYAGNNRSEDLAEAVRLFVASNGGRDRVFDVGMQQWIEGATLAQRYRNRFRTLEAYFDQRPSEMQALRKELRTTLTPLLAVAAAGIGKVGYDFLKEWMDEDKDKGLDGPGDTKAPGPPPASPHARP